MLRLVLVPVLFAVAACTKAPAAQSTAPSNKAEPPANSAVADDALGFLPLDSELVVGVDANVLRASALWAKFEPQIVAQLGNKLPMIRDKCGFDPLRSIERVAAGGKLGPNDTFEGVVVIRGVSGAKTLECLAKQTEGEASVTSDRGIVVVDRGGDEKFVATVVASNTLVIQLGPAASAATLDAVMRSGAPLRGSPTFMTLFGRREAGASVWGMLNGNASVLKQMAQAGAKPKSVDGTLVVTDRFTGALRVTFSSPAEADQMKQAVAPVVPMLTGKLDKIDMTVNGAILRADVVATDEQVRALMGMLGAFM